MRVTHFIVEFYGCDRELISSSREIRRLLQGVVRKAKLTKIRSYFHQFKPAGVTGVILLRESHISIHTWPELGYAAIDLFTCGARKNVLEAYRILIANLRPRRIKKREIKRGADGAR